MAKERAKNADKYYGKENAKFADTISAAKTLVEGADYSDGYPSVFNENMHINRDRPANGGGNRLNKKGG